VKAAKWSKVTLDNPIFAQLITEFPAFTKSATVITRCSQQPTIDLYPGARQSNWHIHIYLYIKKHLNMIPRSTPGATKWSLNFPPLHQNIVYSEISLSSFFFAPPTLYFRWDSVRNHHHHQILLLLVEHRASMKSFQELLSPAIILTSFHDLLLLLISSSVVFRHVLFGLPLFLYPWGF